MDCIAAARGALVCFQPDIVSCALRNSVLKTASKGRLALPIIDLRRRWHSVSLIMDNITFTFGERVSGSLDLIVIHLKVGRILMNHRVQVLQRFSIECRNCIGFALLHSVIGSKFSHHFVNQSEVKPKPIVRAHFPALCVGYV